MVQITSKAIEFIGLPRQSLGDFFQRLNVNGEPLTMHVTLEALHQTNPTIPAGAYHELFEAGFERFAAILETKILTGNYQDDKVIITTYDL